MFIKKGLSILLLMTVFTLAGCSEEKVNPDRLDKLTIERLDDYGNEDKSSFEVILNDVQFSEDTVDMSLEEAQDAGYKGHSIVMGVHTVGLPIDRIVELWEENHQKGEDESDGDREWAVYNVLWQINIPEVNEDMGISEPYLGQKDRVKDLESVDRNVLFYRDGKLIESEVDLDNDGYFPSYIPLEEGPIAHPDATFTVTFKYNDIWEESGHYYLLDEKEFDQSADMIELYVEENVSEFQEYAVEHSFVE